MIIDPEFGEEFASKSTLVLSPRILALDEIAAWREEVYKLGLRVVMTNGCFDILHAGHVRMLEFARGEGDLLLIAINSDASTRALKGKSRPINHEADRAEVLLALRAVNAVTIFDGIRCDDVIEVLQPDVYVKGGDYNLKNLAKPEREVLIKNKTRIVFTPFLEGRSSSNIIKKSKEN